MADVSVPTNAARAPFRPSTDVVLALAAVSLILIAGFGQSGAQALATVSAWALASGLLIRRVRVGPTATRRPMALIAAAALLALIVATISMLRAGVGISLGTSSSATWGQIALVVAAPFLLAGLLVLPTAKDMKRRIQTLLDTVVAALAFGLLVWQSIAGSGDASISWTALTTAVVAAVLATAVVWVLGHSGDNNGLAAPVVWWTASGVFVLVVAQVAAAASGASGTDRWQLMLSALSASCLAAAASIDPTQPHREPSTREVLTRQRVAVLAPMLPLVVAAVALIAWTTQGRPLPPSVIALSVTLLVALVISTLLTRLDSLDVTRTLEHRVAERTLALGTREKWFSGLVQNSSDVITVVDVDGTVRYQTPSASRVLGHDPGLLVGTKITGLLRPEDGRRLLAALANAESIPGSVATLEFPLWHRDGRWCETESTVTSLIHDPRIRGVVLNTRDVSERRRLEEELTRQAFSDGLTGLANRVFFRDSVDEALTDAEAGHVAVVFMDLNGFKAVNDSQGHAVGDHLLTLVGQRLRNCVRPGDVVARLGGDEFAVLVSSRQAEAGAMWVADRVRRVLASDFVLDGRNVTLGAALGIAVNDDGTETADQLLRNADLAMYRAKAAQRSEFLRFEASMHDDLVARVDAEKDLRAAVEHGDLQLHYQPLVDLESGAVLGAEALVRWLHPERGLVAPEHFIDLAEETGLVEQIGAWALREATKAAVAWQSFAPVGLPFRVSVNVSARQVGSSLPRTVRDALSLSGLPAGTLTLEMTESVLMERPEESAAILARLKTLGVRIAVDDFGTGYSSLSYLSRFPVDVLKIDRSFVEHVDHESEQTELVRTIVQLGEALQLTTVAEGIETPAQRDAVRAMGCTLGQGYLFSKALPSDQMAEFLAQRAMARR